MKNNVKKIGKSNVTGTKITFSPDEEIFQTIEFDREKIISHLRQQAYLPAGLRWLTFREASAI